MKIVIAPQAFKGSLTAMQAARAIETGVKRAKPGAETVLAPVADGGDGTLEVLQLGDGAWGALGDTAVIEMAKVCGLALLAHPQPLESSTYALGELIRSLLDQGFRRFIIGMGGSATNDAGTGMAKALGARFLDDDGRELPLGGGSLHRLARLDLTRLDPRIKEAAFQIACDVQNSLLGPEGAAPVFAPQKGASPSDVEVLEAGFSRLAALAGNNIGERMWGGAAGGTAAGAALFLQGELQSGVELILKLIHFDTALSGADLVIVGEGRIDSQTAYHKAPFGVARKAKEKKIPVIAVAGSLGPGFGVVHQIGIQAVLPLSFSPGPISKNSAQLLSQAAEQAVRLTQILTLSR